MGRPANIKIDGKKLDEDIRNHEGSKFNATKISKFIMGKNTTYYCQSIKENNMSEEVLNRVCQYYELDKSDYIVTADVEKQKIQQKADTQNYDNLILLLTGIDRTLKELLAAQKSTQFILNEMKGDLMKSNSNSKAILEKIESFEKSNNARNHTYSKFR